MSDFDLRQAIRVIASERDEWDLDTLTDLVIKATPRNQVATAYRLTLREFVRIELGNQPQNSRPGQTRPDTRTAPAGADSVPNDSQPDQTSFEDHSGAVGLGNHIAAPQQNLARSRTALMRAGFRAQIHAGPGCWKAIEVCTAAELLYAAAECDRMAEFNARRADQYRCLVKLLEENDAETVGDLPTEIVVAVFTNDDH